MLYRDFQYRVSYNSDVLRSALSKGNKLITILPDLYTMTSEPGELHSSIIMRNAHDMLPAAYTGLLVNVQSNGVDAFKITRYGRQINYELKTSEINSSFIWKGVKGGLYLGNHLAKSKVVAVSSYLCAKYSLHSKDNMLTKNMNTILMVCDTSDDDGYFDAWEISGKTVGKYIKQRLGQVTIKLGSFMKKGHQVQTVVPLKGIEQWKTEVSAKAPTKVIGVP